MIAAERTPRDTRGAFSFPTLGGARDCRNLVEDFGGIDLVCKSFKVSSDLVNRYISGQLEPPYTFLLALYWQSRYGFDQAFAESHWTHQYNCFRLAESQEKVKQLERVCIMLFGCLSIVLMLLICYVRPLTWLSFLLLGILQVFL